MQLVSVWSDLYQSTLALYAGRAGGHRWLVAAPPPHAGQATAVLGPLDSKGETVLLVYAGLTPLLSTLREQTDPLLGRRLSGVVIVDRDLAGGPAVSTPLSVRQAEDSGLTYLDGGTYPAWHDALGASGPQEECTAASLCSGLGLPVRVCAPERLRDCLQEWWAVTPHAVAAG